MPELPVHDLTLAAVERELAAPRRRLKFDPLIERAFQAETEKDRVVAMVAAGCVAIALYDLFLVNDWLTLHDRFREMLVARLCIFTPIILGFLALSFYVRSNALAEWSTVSTSALAVLLPMTVMNFSDSSHKLSYQYGSVLVMMFSTVIQRVRFRQAAVGTIAILAIQFTATYACNAFDVETYVAILSFFGSAALLQLIAVYIMERAERRAYLLALRGRLLHEQLNLSARTDPLTGLYNRRHLADVVREVWADSAPRCISAILLDLDHFKLFNDSYGHLQGDDCLQAMSTCILQVVDARIGSVFRFGGEEMLVLLPGIEPAEARHSAEKIQRAIAEAAIPHPMLGEGALVTASMGVAGVLAPDSSAAELIAAADTALYAAKRAGRSCIWPPAGRVAIAVATPHWALESKRA